MTGLTIEWDGAVATIVLPGPALNRAVKQDLRDLARAVAEDDNARAVVLAGTGKAFCVGQDLGEHAQTLRADAAHAFETVDRHYNPIVRGITGMPKPVVAG